LFSKAVFSVCSIHVKCEIPARDQPGFVLNCAVFFRGSITPPLDIVVVKKKFHYSNVFSTTLIAAFRISEYIFEKRYKIMFSSCDIKMARIKAKNDV